MVFLGSSCRETAKKRDKLRLKKKSMGKDERKKVFFPQLFRPKVFDMYFPQKVFYGVFELPLLRNAQKRWLKTKGKKKTQLFRPKVFDMDFPQKVFYGVFELPLLRNAQKRHKKNLKIKKKKRHLPTPFIICQVYVAFNFIFLRRPSIC
jgi:hypothetical protein